jgi:hypothetical protein
MRSNRAKTLHFGSRFEDGFCAKPQRGPRGRKEFYIDGIEAADGGESEPIWDLVSYIKSLEDLSDQEGSALRSRLRASLDTEWSAPRGDARQDEGDRGDW